jgi:hypothetical protein
VRRFPLRRRFSIQIPGAWNDCHFFPFSAAADAGVRNKPR